MTSAILPSLPALPDGYKPLYSYFGGKAKIARVVWLAIGSDVRNYIEPFYGSGAVHWLRPGGVPTGIETINDADGFVANVWRSIQHNPDAVARYADWPVNEADLHARHLWLIGQRERLTERLMGDPDYHDPKIAGWWVWGQSCWIGSGWCTGEGPWVSIDGVFTRSDAPTGHGIHRKRPHLSNKGCGVCRQRPHLSGKGQGVCRQLPHLSDRGTGVRLLTPPGFDDHLDYLTAWMRTFRDRMARVRVCCGDWYRVVASDAITVKHGTTGVFLDPPYANTAGRDPRLYAVDSLKVAHDVREWAIERGSDPRMRIVLAGYDGEHHMPPDWRVIKWKANGGMANIGNNQGKANRHRERLWLSPHCLHPTEPSGAVP